MNPARFNQLAEEVGLDIQLRRRGYKHAVITVHGVTTTGKWQKEFGTVASDHEIRAEHVDYDYTFPALTPKSKADRAASSFLEKYMAQRQWRLPISAVGHSFGTLVIGRALQTVPTLSLDRVILSSAILDPAFDWSAMLDTGRLSGVMNEHCPSDRVVPFSRSWKLWGIPVGKAGCNGFTGLCGGRIVNVHYGHVGHTKLITKLHMERAWLPYLLSGKVPPGDPRPKVGVAGEGPSSI